MRVASTTQTGVGTSPWLPIDPYTSGPNTGVYCLVTGTATYSVEITPDDVQSGGTINAYACNVTALTAATTTQSASLVQPCRAVRVNVASGTGTVVLKAVVSGAI